MTTFYQTEGKATVVWDAEQDCALCEFANRQLETDDPRVIAKLEELGYPKQGQPLNYSDAEQMAQIDQINDTGDSGASPQEMAEKAAAPLAKPTRRAKK
jgi:hypothetical protein